MDMPRVRALSAYREKTPPESVSMHKVCMMLEAFFGIESNNPQHELDDVDEDDLEAALANFPQG